MVNRLTNAQLASEIPSVSDLVSMCRDLYEVDITDAFAKILSKEILAKHKEFVQAIKSPTLKSPWITRNGGAALSVFLKSRLLEVGYFDTKTKPPEDFTATTRLHIFSLSMNETPEMLDRLNGSNEELTPTE